MGRDAAHRRDHAKRAAAAHVLGASNEFVGQRGAPISAALYPGSIQSDTLGSL
jgi:hypothetical protein